MLVEENVGGITVLEFGNVKKTLQCRRHIYLISCDALLVGSLKKDQKLLAQDVEGLGNAIDNAVAKVKVKWARKPELLQFLTIYLCV